jgi:hypothetical protein
MRRFAAVGLLWLAATGCAVAPPVTDPVWQTTNVFHDNPVLLPVGDHELAWETVVDVVDDHFKIQEEEPVRRVGDVVTEGRLDTFWAVGSTVFEPWRRDSANAYEKLESTLQSIRRRATVRVRPAQGGYLVDVAVFKELEDAARPMHASAGAATFRNDSSLTRVVDVVGEQEVNEGWISLGRDTALEQRMIQQLTAKAGVILPPCTSPTPAPYTPTPGPYGPGPAPQMPALGPQMPAPQTAPPQILPLPAPPSTDG